MNKFRKTLIYSLVMIFIVSCSIKETQSKANSLQIHEIQGCSHVSPYNGFSVTNIEGVVTHKVSNGFTMQALDEDELDCSSEGIFVFTDEFPEVITGDVVLVDGQVSEFSAGEKEDANLSITEIIKPEISIIRSDQKLPDPVILDDQASLIPNQIIEDDSFNSFDIQYDGLDYLESLESMLVEIRTGIVVAPRNEYNEIVILSDSFAQVNVISDQGALLASNSDRNPEKINIKLPSSFDDSINVGTILSEPLVGVMDYSYGNYKLLSLSVPKFVSGLVIDEGITEITEGLSIVTYNLENLSPYDDSFRFKEFADQIVNVLKSPDILVLHEIMDDSGTADNGTVEADTTISRLITEIENKGGPEYRYSDAPPENNKDGGIEGGNIRSVLLYRNDRGISLTQPEKIHRDWNFETGEFSVAQNPLRIGEYEQAFAGTRKPPLWLLEQNGKQFFVLGVHLVSQGSNTPEWGTIQPPLRESDQKRIAQAEIIHAEVERLIESYAEVPIIVAGDLNDLPWSETVNMVTQNLLINSAFYENENERFSYIFEGNAQQLDYLLITTNLADKVSLARFVHINTVLDREDQISDHDPFYLAIEFTP